MRILHTSDWHVGRMFHGFSLLEHHAVVFDALVETVRSEQVDIVVIAGDLYDRALPAADAISLCDDTLAALRAAGARVIAISGNHDSGPRLGFGERSMTAGGVTIRGRVERLADPVTIPATDGGTDLACFLVPYLEPELARHALGAPEARTQAAVWEAAGAAIEGARAGLGAHRSLLVAHAFVAGGIASESERPLSVGGSEHVEPRALRGFDYVALGHLHRRQIFGREPSAMRYSGSPLAYSFSEAADEKSAWLVDLAVDGSVAVEAVTLPVPRRLVTMTGTLESLLEDPALDQAVDAWVRAEVTDPVVPRDPMDQLRQRFPYVAHLVIDPPARATIDLTYRERTAGRTDVEIATEFLAAAAGIDGDDATVAELQQAFESARVAAVTA
jgi:exonuclease SbcD